MQNSLSDLNMKNHNCLFMHCSFINNIDKQNLTFFFPQLLPTDSNSVTQKYVRNDYSHLCWKMAFLSLIISCIARQNCAKCIARNIVLYIIIINTYAITINCIFAREYVRMKKSGVNIQRSSTITK